MRTSRRWSLGALPMVLWAVASLPMARSDGLDPQYLAAVNDAKQNLTPAKIDYNLTTIGPNDHIRSTQLDKDGIPRDAILMSNFGDWTIGSLTGYNRAYDGTHATRPVLWSAVAPEMWQFFQTNNVAPQDMSLRAKQLLGLPNTSTAYYVTEFYVRPESLFRPAMDPDITHPVTSLTFSGQMADPTSDMRKWFDANYATYTANPPYPWTRAGYTYDWGTDVAPHIGLSEFIAWNQNLHPDPAKSWETYRESPIWVRSVISLISYKYYVRETDSFNVTDYCDTIWMGSNFLPVTPGGNKLDIAAGVTIAGGEGITVTDMAGADQASNVTITNAGTILGPSRNHDNSPRDSSVYFTNTGGVLVNSGTITGDKVGVLAGDACARPIVIANTGTIRGTEAAIRTGAGDDRVTTGGLVDGRIETRGGNDAIYVTGGAINGSIDGGTGTNVLNFNLPSDANFTYFNNILNMSQVNVNSGLVRINGQATGDVTIASGATLGGNFTVFGGLGNYGSLAPGNSIGAVTVNGNYTQAYGGHLEVEIARTTSGTLVGDQLHVANTATLATGSVIDVAYAGGSGSVFCSGDLYHVIAAGTLTDPHATIAFDSAFLDIVGVKQDNDYVLRLRNVAQFSSVAAPGNNTTMAKALDRDAVSAAGDYADWLDRMLFTDAATFNGTLRQISPAAYLSVSAATDRTTQYMAESLGGYLRGRRAGQINPCCFQTASLQGSVTFAQAVGSPTELAETAKYCPGQQDMVCEPQEIDRTRSVWVNPFGVFYGERSTGDHLGFQSNVAGVQLGIDKLVDENTIFGIGGGYDQMHINTADQLSAGKTDTFRVGPYASWFTDEWYFDASLTGGFHANNVGRLVNVVDDLYQAHGLYNANDLSLYAGGGWDYHLGEYTVSPLLSMQFIYYRQNGFTESDGQVTSLAVDPLDAHSLRSRVGVQVARVGQWGQAKIVPEVFAGWAHEYMENDVLEARLVGGTTPFGIDRGGVFRDAGYYGVSLTALARERASLFVRYNGEYSCGGHFTAVDLGAAVAY